MKILTIHEKYPLHNIMILFKHLNVGSQGKCFYVIKFMMTRKKTQGNEAMFSRPFKSVDGLREFVRFLVFFALPSTKTLSSKRVQQQGKKQVKYL